MYAEVERPLSSGVNLLCNVMTSSEKEIAVQRGLSYIGHGCCNSL